MNKNFNSILLIDLPWHNLVWLSCKNMLLTSESSMVAEIWRYYDMDVQSVVYVVTYFRIESDNNFADNKTVKIENWSKSRRTCVFGSNGRLPDPHFPLFIQFFSSNFHRMTQPSGGLFVFLPGNRARRWWGGRSRVDSYARALSRPPYCRDAYSVSALSSSDDRCAILTWLLRRSAFTHSGRSKAADDEYVTNW